MADPTPFEIVCQELEQTTSLERLEARGTVRLALKAAGLDASTATPQQLAVMVERLLPAELASRGIAEGEGVCRRLVRRLGTLETTPARQTPEDVFARLGGRAPV